LLVRHGREVNCVVFSPDGKWLVTASGDHTARVWDAATGKPRTPRLGHQKAVLRALFSADGSQVATMSEDNTARVWDATTGKAVTPSLQHEAAIWHVAFSADGRLLLTASEDQVTRLWDVRKGRVIHSMAGPRPKNKPARKRRRFEHERIDKPNDHARAGWADVPDNPEAALADEWIPPPAEKRSRRPVQLVQAEVLPPSLGEQPPPTPATTAAAPATTMPSFTPAPSPATAPPGSVAVGRRTPPERLPRFLNPKASVLSPDKRLLVTGYSDHNGQVWEAATGKALVALRDLGGPVFHTSFHQDGRQILIAAGRQACVWDCQTGKAAANPLRHTGTVYRAEFSPDGRYVVTASEDGTARVWDARSGMPLGPPLRQFLPVFQVSFSPDGRRVLTVCTSHARVWDRETGEPLSAAFVHQDDLTSASFRPDGLAVVTAGRDGTVRIWDIPPPENRPRAELVLLTQVLSLRQFDPQGGFVPVKVADLANAYRELQANSTAALPGPREQTQAWHLQEAADAEKEGQWFAAAWHLARLAEAKRADQMVRFYNALTWCAAGQREAYQQACAGFLRNPTLAWVCTLGPDGVRDPPQMVKLAATAVKEKPEDFDRVLTLGAALYRAGKLKGAVEHLHKAAKLRKEAPAAWLFLAMVYQRLEQPEEAHKWLGRALEWTTLARPLPTDAAHALLLPWQHPLALQILLREAKEVLGVVERMPFDDGSGGREKI
jgi:WD40 repeat protein